MVKLLITYDIDEKDEDKRSNLEIFLSNEKEHSKWVHLQGSVWVVLSKESAESNFVGISEYLPNSSISVIDVSQREVYYTSYIEASKPNGIDILSSRY